MNVAFMYHEGQGVTKSFKQALYWYKEAALQGNTKAQYNVGVMYYEGEGVTQDYIEAHKWFNISSINGFSRSITQRGNIEKKMTQSQVERAKKIAKEWMAEHQ